MPVPKKKPTTESLHGSTLAHAMRNELRRAEKMACHAV